MERRDSAQGAVLRAWMEHRVLPVLANYDFFRSMQHRSML